MDDIWGFNSKKAKQAYLTQAIHYPTKSFNYVSNQYITKCLNYYTCIGVHLEESSLVPKLVIRWRVLRRYVHLSSLNGTLVSAYTFHYLMDMNTHCSQVFWLCAKYNIYSRLLTLLPLRLSKCFVICDVEKITLYNLSLLTRVFWSGFFLICQQHSQQFRKHERSSLIIHMDMDFVCFNTTIEYHYHVKY